MGDNYTLRFKNRSDSQHDFLVYQKGIEVNMPNIYTLAWFAKPVANGVDVDFTWTIDYSFVWSEQGQLKPGITFHANQVVVGDLLTANLIDFSKVDGAFQFGKPTGTGASGSLTIDGDNSIPKHAAKVGIGPDKRRGYGLAVALSVSLPVLDADIAAKRVDAAHEVCPYSNATRDNIDVTIVLG